MLNVATLLLLGALEVYILLRNMCAYCRNRKKRAFKQDAEDQRLQSFGKGRDNMAKVSKSFQNSVEFHDPSQHPDAWQDKWAVGEEEGGWGERGEAGGELAEVEELAAAAAKGKRQHQKDRSVELSETWGRPASGRGPSGDPGEVRYVGGQRVVERTAVGAARLGPASTRTMGKKELSLFMDIRMDVHQSDEGIEYYHGAGQGAATWELPLLPEGLEWVRLKDENFQPYAAPRLSPGDGGGGAIGGARARGGVGNPMHEAVASGDSGSCSGGQWGAGRARGGRMESRMSRLQQRESSTVN